jgi:hypothetical protein
MERFFFGAYEDIDDVISFLKSIAFVEFSSTKNADLKTVDKRYYITQIGIDRAETELGKLPALDWYVHRCNLIKKYFGGKSGAELRAMQYEIEEYKETVWRDRIREIEDKVRGEFFSIYGETV